MNLFLILLQDSWNREPHLKCDHTPGLEPVAAALFLAPLRFKSISIVKATNQFW